MNIYTGYVYLWYDTKAKLFYLGGHKGKVGDSYICSNAKMLNAYKKRPNTFKFRVLEYVTGDNNTLRLAEQKWLDKIKDEELYWIPNIYAKTVRYYNQKKQSSGGNGSANLGKPKTCINGNAFKWKITDPLGNEHIVNKTHVFCKERGINWSTLYLNWKNGKITKRGRHKGYVVELVDSVSKLN